MNEEDVGVTLSVPTTVSLQFASTVSLIVKSPKGIVTTIPMVVGTTPLLDSNGNTVAAPYFWAYRVTTNTDFPVYGVYQIQIVEVTGSTSNIASDIVQLNVGKRISP